MIVVEAKKNDFDQGWAQCLAELVVAQKINQDAKRPVYGIVTDANLWQFGGECFLPKTWKITLLIIFPNCMAH